MVYYGYPICQSINFFKVVACKYNGHIESFPDFPHVFPHLASGLHIEAKSGFIKKKYLGFIDQTSNQLKPFSHSSGILPHIPVGGFIKFNQFENLCNLFLWKYVREIRETLNVTIILTSHYLEEVDALADRISIIDHGKILVTDSPSQLKSNLNGDMIQLAAKNREERDILRTYPGALEVKNDSDETGILLKVSSSDSELPSLMKFISERNIGITKITIHKPSLDEVFLEYTGRDIREQETEDFRKTMINMRRLRN